MKPLKLVVNIDAHFDWMEPTDDPAVQAMREQASVLAKATAHQLNYVVELMVLELLNAKVQ